MKCYLNDQPVVDVLWDTGAQVSIESETGLLVGRGKKNQSSRDFQGQLRGRNGQFRGNFEASFAEKPLIKNGRFRGSFPSKFRWKAIGFALFEESFQ